MPFPTHSSERDGQPGPPQPASQPGGVAPSAPVPSQSDGSAYVTGAVPRSEAGDSSGEKPPQPLWGVSWLLYPIYFSEEKSQTETSAFGQLDYIQVLLSKNPPQIKGDSAPKSNLVVIPEAKLVYDF